MEENKRKTVYNPEADKKWRDNNKEHVRYLNDRSASRRFIREKATLEDLAELETLIRERKQNMKDDPE